MSAWRWSSLAPVPAKGIVAILFAAVSLIIALVLFAGATESHPGVTLDHFKARLDRLAGPDAILCDDVAIPSQREVPQSDCVLRAIREEKAFRVVYVWDGFGHGMGEWTGYARGPDRVVWSAHFSTGYGYTTHPQFILRRCDRFRPAASFKQPLFC